MKNNTNLLLGFHGHIPVESLKNISESEITKNYLKLIELLESHKNIKSTLHLSGDLLTYLDKKTNDFSGRLRDLLDKNLLELFGGGIYEPIFPFIPKEDRQTQLQLMNRLLNHIYGYTPHGAWIPEFSWEPSIALELAKSRIQYTCLSKEYFIRSGLEESELSGYYLTEEEGRKVAVFPVTYKLDDFIENDSPESAIKHISESTKDSKNNLIVLFYNGLIDDPEKLKWIESLLKSLSKETESLQTKLFNEYFQTNKPKGRIYLPDFQDIKSKNMVGSWKNFLLKYPEANLLHKKMLRVSKKINSAKEGKSRFKVIKEMISQAQDLLLKGQCNNSYWDTNIGGIYLPQSRHNTYSNLIKAEKLIDSASRHGSKWIQVSEIDYDCDGNDEIIIETESQNIYLSPALGGTILEHDYRPTNANLTNIVSRKKELYHTVNGSQNSSLIYDKYTKTNLIDHFLQNNLKLEDCLSNKLNSLTEDTLYPCNVEKIKAKEETCKIAFVNLIRLTKLPEMPEIELKKQISTRAGESSLFVEYTLTNKSKEKVSFIFGVEFNLSITPTPNQENYFYLDGNPKTKTQKPYPDSAEEIKDINQISLKNKLHGFDLTLSSNLPFTLFRYPIETMTLNFKKLESINQGNTLLFAWNTTLEPEIPLEICLNQNIFSGQEESH